GGVSQSLGEAKARRIDGQRCIVDSLRSTLVTSSYSPLPVCPSSFCIALQLPPEVHRNPGEQEYRPYRRIPRIREYRARNDIPRRQHEAPRDPRVADRPERPSRRSPDPGGSVARSIDE